MTVKMAYHNGSVVPEEITQDNSEEITQLLKYATLCCDGSIIINGTEIGQIGDPTETSILVAAYLNGIIKEELAKEYERVAEIPFDSERKLMSVIVRDGEEYLVIVKGGFDVITQCCNEVDFSQCENIVESFSKEALRVLAVAYKRLQIFPQEITSEELECNLNFMGIVGMIDPPREEAKQAVALCKEAGIRPIMITGDHVMTASAIARQLGILNEKEEAITGSELEHMTEEELQHRVRNISVYARVSPEDKIRIVKAWKSQGEVVAMTGDGVNDAPALKAADIGCAMGITGTDVAKGAADMTLTDDNFATIVEAVREGRGIYDNIRKTVAFLLGTNIGEVITVFFAMLFFKTSPLLSMHLLWINLVTDSFPAIALGMEPVDKNIMRKHPRRRDESIFAEGLGTKIALQGIMFGVLSIFAFYYGCRFQVSDQTIDSGRTMAFAVLGLSQIVHSFNMRSDRSLFEIGVFSNKTLNMACGISFILMCFILFVPPVTYAFGLVSLSTFQYIVIILLSSIPLIVLEGSKKMTEED